MLEERTKRQEIEAAQRALDHLGRLRGAPAIEAIAEEGDGIALPGVIHVAQERVAEGAVGEQAVQGGQGLRVLDQHQRAREDEIVELGSGALPEGRPRAVHGLQYIGGDRVWAQEWLAQHVEGEYPVVILEELYVEQPIQSCGALQGAALGQQGKDGLDSVGVWVDERGADALAPERQPEAFHKHGFADPAHPDQVFVRSQLLGIEGESPRPERKAVSQSAQDQPRRASSRPFSHSWSYASSGASSSSARRSG